MIIQKKDVHLIHFNILFTAINKRTPTAPIPEAFTKIDIKGQYLFCKTKRML